MSGASVRLLAEFMGVSDAAARRWLRDNGDKPRRCSPVMCPKRERERRAGVRLFKASKKAAGETACEVCAWAPPERAWRAMHAHHVIPVATGGSDHADNLVLVCPTCHGLAHALFEQRYGAQAAYFGPTTRETLIASLRVAREKPEG